MDSWTKQDVYWHLHVRLSILPETFSHTKLIKSNFAAIVYHGLFMWAYGPVGMCACGHLGMGTINHSIIQGCNHPIEYMAHTNRHTQTSYLQSVLFFFYPLHILLKNKISDHSRCWNYSFYDPYTCIHQKRFSKKLLYFYRAHNVFTTYHDVCTHFKKRRQFLRFLTHFSFSSTQLIIQILHFGLQDLEL